MTPTTLTRWLKFNLVGLLGMAVQLATLAVLNRALHGHYLLATALAIELALLHNFTWHLHYTWPETRSTTHARAHQLLRFHLTNGLISLLGNLTLMAVLVHTAHLPILVANLIAIAVCSTANFFLSHKWTFAGKKAPLEGTIRRGIAATCITIACLQTAHAQTPAAPTAAPKEDRYGTGCAYKNVFAGPSLATGSDNTPSTFTAGITVGEYFARTLGNGIMASPQFELGIIGPLKGGYPLDGLISFNEMFANKLTNRDLYPFLTVGYSRLFVTGNALNFGLGLDFGHDPYKRVVRVELRDYYLFTGPRQHIIGLRIGLGQFVPD